MPRRLFVICNALDDATRFRRGITTDSPAATRKVLLLCRSLRHAGVRPLVISLGRGRPDGSRRRFGASVRRVDGVPVLYAAFSHRPLLSQWLSLLSPAALLWRARRLGGERTVLFYNRMPAYLPTLLLAAALRLRRVLDLEDGALDGPARSLAGRFGAALHRLFDRLCNGGALLACSALAQGTSSRPVLCYYGTLEAHAPRAAWPSDGLAVLLGGTLAGDTGAPLLIAAIERLRSERPAWARGLRVEITGQGESLPAFERLAQGHGEPRVIVHGRTDQARYREILASAQVGLALKPRGGPLSQTTFPSKVVELAGAGLLVLSTDISDVRPVLAPHALFLDDESPAGLVDRLHWIVQHRDQAEDMARAGQAHLLERCEAARSGRALAGFLFGAPA